MNSDNEARADHKDISSRRIEEMESNIFERSRHKDEYLDLTAQLLLQIREMEPVRGDTRCFDSFRQSSTQTQLPRFKNESEFSSSCYQSDEINWIDARSSDAHLKSKSNFSSSRNQSNEINWKDAKPSEARPENESNVSSFRNQRAEINWKSTRPLETHHSLHDRAQQKRGYEVVHDQFYIDSRCTRTRSPSPVKERSYHSNEDRSNHVSREIHQSPEEFSRINNLFDKNLGGYSGSNDQYLPQPSQFPGSTRDDPRHQLTEAEKSVLKPDLSGYKDRRGPLILHDADGSKINLSGAATRKLRRLTEEGVPHEIALKQLLQERKEREAKRDQGSTKNEYNASPTHVRISDPLPSTKRSYPTSFGSRTGSPPRKQLQFSDPRRSLAEEECLKIGIADRHYPSYLLDGSRLQLLRQSIMEAIDDIPVTGPQVRFKRCIIHPGILVLKCADEESLSWVMQNATYLRPWEGAQLKIFSGSMINRPELFTVLIDDESGQKIPQETLFTRLKKMNHGLNTNKWSVINVTKRNNAHLFVLSIDKDSVDVLYKCNLHPYYGFGQVEFRKRVSRTI